MKLYIFCSEKYVADRTFKDVKLLINDNEELPFTISPIRKSVNLVRLDKLSGIGPSKEFPWNLKTSNLVKLPIKSGIFPVKSLSDAHRIFKFLSFENVEGNGPLKPELSKYICSSLAKLPSSEGSSPVKLFKLMPKEIRLVRFPSSFGSVPDNGLIARDRYCMGNFPMNDGTGPVK